jgi:RecA-family ATPase
MNINDIPVALTGDKLVIAMQEAKTERTALAIGFLYKQTILMMSADPGVGKSTISTQVAVELAAGLPVFGVFDVPKPVKVLYVQTERSKLELLERLEVISKVLPIAKDNLVITDEYQHLDLMNFEHVKLFIQCIQRDCPNVEVIFIDPIYSMVRGGLKDDTPASAFVKGMSLVQKHTGATLYYNHHTVKKQYTDKGIAYEKDDPFYGSQWLKAHITGSFYVKSTDSGVDLIRKKDNYKLLPKQLELHYDSETELCSIPHDKLPALERVLTFIKSRAIDQRTFSFNDICDKTELCKRTVRAIFCTAEIKGRIFVVSTNKNKNLYKSQPPK